MRHLTLLLLIAVTAVLSLMTQPPDAQAEGVVWLTDYKAALKQAAAEDKPVFLEFR